MIGAIVWVFILIKSTFLFILMCPTTMVLIRIARFLDATYLVIIMKIEEITTILRENPNFNLIWIPSCEKQHKVLLNRLKNERIAYLFNNKAMIKRESAQIIVERNVSAHKFDCLCSQLPNDLIGRIFC